MRTFALVSALLGAALVAAVAAALAVADQPAVRAHGTVFVTERGAGSVAAFDATSGEVLWKHAVGKTPIGVVRPHGTHKVYSTDQDSDQISVLDDRTGELLTTIGMPAGSLPHHLEATLDGGLIYVGEFGRNYVGVIDTATDTKYADWKTSDLGDARTHAVWITRSGKELYATVTRADRTQIGDIVKLDARTGELLCTLVVGKDPSEILVTNRGDVGYVTVRNENAVKELDLSGDCPTLTGRSATVGTQPDTLRLTNDEDTLVVTLRGAPAAISLLDTRTFDVRQVVIPNHPTSIAGHHWLSANGKYTFVAVESPGELAVVDNDAGVVVAQYPYPGGTRPHGVFAVPEELR
jgi:DNA-binding beta-propeller fold protein YncE